MKRKKNRKKKINPEYLRGLIDGVAIILILVSAISIILLLNPNHKVLSGIDSPNETSMIIDECSNKTLIESAYCVRDITETFFKYNISNIDKYMFDVLKEEGGMCRSWASYWCGIGDKFGYYTKEVSIDIGLVNFTYQGIYDEWDTGHVFCVWSNKDSYIIADGLVIHKFKFNGNFFEGAIIG